MVFGFGKKKIQPSAFFNSFAGLITAYCADENQRLIGKPEDWQSSVISYSFYLGLGITKLDKDLHELLLKSLSSEMIQTSDLALIGLTAVGNMSHSTEGSLWEHAVNALSTLMSLTSPETTGPQANENLVKERAPYTGLIPGLRLSEKDHTYSRLLYDDAIYERETCDEVELQTRILWMQDFINEK